MTKSERQVMDLLWQAEEPLSCSEIVALSEEKTWKDSYVHSLIKSLMKKGIVKIGGFELISRSYARKFSPTISYDEYVIFSNYSEEDLKDTKKMYLFFRKWFNCVSSPKLTEEIQKTIMNDK